MPISFAESYSYFSAVGRQSWNATFGTRCFSCRLSRIYCRVLDEYAFSEKPLIDDFSSLQNADDFKSYYSLLTDRIRKVEEQNLELLRIAERQKFEYDKVSTRHGKGT